MRKLIFFDTTLRDGEQCPGFSMKTEEKNPRMLAKIYRDKDIQKVQEKMNMLGSFQKMDTYTFLNVRLISSIVVFLLLLYFFYLAN